MQLNPSCLAFLRHGTLTIGTMLRRCWLVLLGLLVWSCSPPKADKGHRRGAEGVPVTVAQVALVPLDQTIPVVGTLCARDEATLGAEVEGRVEKTLVEFGDRVKEGDLLAQIDTTTYQALAAQAEANLARAKANALNAEQNLKRVQKLRESSIASQSDLDTATAEAEQNRAAVKAAEATESVARLNLERSRVKAPFEAAVAERIANAGDFMRVGSPLFRVVNDGVLKFIFQVPERDASRVAMDQPVTFTVDAYPGQEFEGRVYLINPQVNLTPRTFYVGARVQNPDRKLKANTFARGQLIVQRAVPTLVVPLDAVIYFAGVSKVYVVDKDLVRGRQVEVGRVKAGTQEVLAGVRAGETVVVSGHGKLFDGAKVRLKENPKAETANARE
jgi:membrane fusion protein, multidrug efflux system